MKKEDIEKSVNAILNEFDGFESDEEMKDGIQSIKAKLQEIETEDLIEILKYIEDDLDLLVKKRKQYIKEQSIKEGKQVISVSEGKNAVFILPESEIDKSDWISIIEGYRKDYLVGFEELVLKGNIIVIGYKGYKDIALCFDEDTIDTIYDVYKILSKEFKIK